MSEENTKMQGILEDSPAPPAEGEIIEGTVSAIGRARVYIELHPFGQGLIFGREYMNARDILRKVSIGDTIAAKVADSSNGPQCLLLLNPIYNFHSPILLLYFKYHL